MNQACCGFSQSPQLICHQGISSSLLNIVALAKLHPRLSFPICKVNLKKAWLKESHGRQLRLGVETGLKGAGAYLETGVNSNVQGDGDFSCLEHLCVACTQALIAPLSHVHECVMRKGSSVHTCP